MKLPNKHKGGNYPVAIDSLRIIENTRVPPPFTLPFTLTHLISLQRKKRRKIEMQHPVAVATDINGE